MSHVAPERTVGFVLNVFARNGPDDFRRSFVEETEHVGPVGVDVVFTIFAVDDVLANLSTFGIHVLADVNLGAEVKASAQSGSHSFVNHVCFHGTEHVLGIESRKSFRDERVGVVESLFGSRTAAHFALGGCVERHTAEEVETAEGEVSHENLLLGNHRFASTLRESESVEVNVLKRFEGVPSKSLAHGEVFPAIADKAHVVVVFVVVVTLIVTAVVPVATAGRDTDFVGT